MRYDELTQAIATGKRYELVPFEVTIRRCLSKALLSGLKFRVEDNQFLHYLAYDVQTAVWAEQIDTDVVTREVRVPADWWQHLKANLFPEWLKERFPVRLVTYTLTVTRKLWRTWPDIELPFDAPHRYVMKTTVHPHWEAHGLDKEPEGVSE